MCTVKSVTLIDQDVVNIGHIAFSDEWSTLYNYIQNANNHAQLIIIVIMLSLSMIIVSKHVSMSNLMRADQALIVYIRTTLVM